MRIDDRLRDHPKLEQYETDETFDVSGAFVGQSATTRTSHFSGAQQMFIRAGYELAFAATSETPVVAMLNVRPERVRDLRAGHAIVNDRGLAMQHYHDVFGNFCTRVTLPAGITTISCDFVIEDCGEPDRQASHAIQHAVADLPNDVLIYLVGSRYCDTDLLSNIAWALFGNVPEGWARVQAIVDFVHQHLTYGYQYARATRTAYEAYQERVGVCRDFAHLAVALCRCMNIPARYCSGYLGDIGIDPVDVAMDFHAWFEAYLGGEWHSFDARHRVPRIGRILMACGRDAADTALTTAFGSVQLMRFKVITEEIDARLDGAPWGHPPTDQLMKADRQSWIHSGPMAQSVNGTGGAVGSWL